MARPKDEVIKLEIDSRTPGLHVCTCAQTISPIPPGTESNWPGPVLHAPCATHPFIVSAMNALHEQAQLLAAMHARACSDTVLHVPQYNPRKGDALLFWTYKPDGTRVTSSRCTARAR